MKLINLLIPVLLTLTHNAFAATVKSPAYPLNGSYTNHQISSCTADIASNLPATYASSYTNHQVGVLTYVSDTASYNGSTSLQGLTGWLATAALRVFPSPIALFNSSQDPSASVGTKLNETPIQWGTQTFQSANADITSPYATLPSFYIGPEKSYFVMTSYKYAFPANIGNVQTGYAFYNIKAGKTSWNRYLVYSPNISTTARLISASYAGNFTNSLTFSPNPSSFIFDCLESGIVTQ